MSDSATVQENRTTTAPARWWETSSGMTRPYLKVAGRTLLDLIADLDRLRADGFDAIEVFAPFAGGVCYNGLDTIDFYTIDPALGGMEDFTNLIAAAHARRMAVIIFINLGYAHEQFPAFLKACDDVRAGIDSRERRMFVWSDTGRDHMPKPLAPFFLQDTHGHWRWSDRAQKYFWVKWEGERGGFHLPQFNWGDPGWQAEVQKILRFWLDLGIDGVVVDAVNWYIDCDWEITRHAMTDVINAFPNQFSQPEGAGGFGDAPAPWITEGRFNCVMDYAVKLWWEGKDVIRDAILSGDPRPIEAALRSYRDLVVAAGGVCYIDTPELTDSPPEAQLLGAATVATIGELLLDTGDRFATATQGYREQLSRVLRARRDYPALCAGGERRQLATNDDSRYYAFVRHSTARQSSMVVVLNFQPHAEQIALNLRGRIAGSLVDIWSDQAHAVEDMMEIELPAYGYAIYRVEGEA